MEISKLNRLVEQFSEAAIRSDEATISGSGKDARKYANKMIRLRKKIWEFGDQGKEALSKVLDHPHPSARVAAAGYLLKFRTEEALGVLREAAQHEGLVPFVAQEALKRWEEGVPADWE